MLRIIYNIDLYGVDNWDNCILSRNKGHITDTHKYIFIDYLYFEQKTKINFHVNNNNVLFDRIQYEMTIFLGFQK